MIITIISTAIYIRVVGVFFRSTADQPSLELDARQLRHERRPIHRLGRPPQRAQLVRPRAHARAPEQDGPVVELERAPGRDADDAGRVDGAELLEGLCGAQGQVHDFELAGLAEVDAVAAVRQARAARAF